MSQDILWVFLLSTLSSANDVNLATNTNILLLLLLGLNNNNFNNGINNTLYNNQIYQTPHIKRHSCISYFKLSYNIFFYIFRAILLFLFNDSIMGRLYLF